MKEIDALMELDSIDISAKAISMDEWNVSELAPKCIVENYLYADVSVIAAPGGTGKTTMLLYEAVHIALGRQLWGLSVVTSGATLFITKEDPRERLVARLRRICEALGLTEEETSLIRENLLILDLTSTDTRFIRNFEGNLLHSEIVDQICTQYQKKNLAMMVIDPLVSFGPSDASVNVGEQAMVEVARRFVGDLKCCVRYVHHTGQEAARSQYLDQYAIRGGSALPDGARCVAIMQRWNVQSKQIPPASVSTSPGIDLLMVSRPKISHAPPNQPLIWLERQGFTYEAKIEHALTPEQLNRAYEDQILRYLTSQVKDGVLHTKRSLEEVREDLKIPRNAMRRALAVLMARGDVVEENMPAGMRRGQRKIYLRPNAPIR